MDVNVQDGRKRIGWWWADNEIFDVKLKPSTFVVYCYLCRIADNNSSIATISYRNLAKKLGLSTRTVQSAINELEEKMLISKSKRVNENGKVFANVYKLTPKEVWKIDSKAEAEDDSVVKNTTLHRGKNYHNTVAKNTTHRGKNYHTTVVKNTTLPENLAQEHVDTQRDEEGDPNTTNTLYIKTDLSNTDHHQHINKGCDDVENNSHLLPAKNGKKENGSAGVPKAVSRNNGKPTNKLADILEQVKGWGLRRLSPEQATFFLLNSSFDKHIVKKEILKADTSGEIRNPVGFLIDVLKIDLKKAEHRELLLYEREPEGESESEWRETWKGKIRRAKSIAEHFGVDVGEVDEPESEEEAHMILQGIGKAVAEVVDSNISEDAVKHIGEESREQVLMELRLRDAGVPVEPFNMFLGGMS